MAAGKVIDTVPASMVGAAIYSDVGQLQVEAQRAQEAWFRAPKDNTKRQEFAKALERWAKATGNTTALEHAQGLME